MHVECLADFLYMIIPQLSLAILMMKMMVLWLWSSSYLLIYSDILSHFPENHSKINYIQSLLWRTSHPGEKMGS